MEAIDTSHELSGGAWPQDIATSAAAWALTRPDDPVIDPDALSRWLRQAGKGPLREHGPARHREPDGQDSLHRPAALARRPGRRQGTGV